VERYRTRALHLRSYRIPIFSDSCFVANDSVGLLLPDRIVGTWMLVSFDVLRKGKYTVFLTRTMFCRCRLTRSIRARKQASARRQKGSAARVRTIEFQIKRCQPGTSVQRIHVNCISHVTLRHWLTHLGCVYNRSL
jgi:hypothetical protein